MKYIYILLISIACLTLTGCGGGGGGDNGITLTPQQQEFADVVYAFATAVNDKDKEKAKKLIMADVVYNKNNGYEDFRIRLENFIDKAENIDFQINDIGVRFIEEDKEAEILADIAVSYKINDIEKTMSERVEIYVEKSSSLKGINLFQKYKSEVSAFPPVLE